MGTYAKDTVVSPEKSLIEIQATLKRYKAARFGFIEDGKFITIGFEMCGRQVRFHVPMPTYDDGVRAANQYQAGGFNQGFYDQKVKQRWRALTLCIKAKLESQESGIETFEAAFMAQLVLPEGITMEEWAQPQLREVFANQGKLPPLLGSGN